MKMPSLSRQRNIPLAALAVTALWTSAWGAVEHKVTERDHLWGLAKRYYDDPYRWRLLAEANAQIVKDPHWIYPGQILIIPDIPAPSAEAQSVEAAAPVSAPPPAAPEPSSPNPPEAPKPSEDVSQDLSVDMPPSMIGHYDTAARLKVSRDWKEDGRITEFEGREIIAAEGDMVNGKLSSRVSVAIGDKFAVYRRDTVRELDEDSRADYLQRVGVVQAKEDLGHSAYRFLILKSLDSIQLGDVFKRE